MLANSKVSARIQQLQERQLAAVDASATWIVQQAVTVVNQAIESGQLQHVAPNLALLAKRHPEFSDKRDVNVSQRTEIAQIVASMTPDEMREYVRRTLGEGK